MVSGKTFTIASMRQAPLASRFASELGVLSACQSMQMTLIRRFCKKQECDLREHTPVAWSKQAARTRALGAFAAALPALALLWALLDRAFPFACACCAFAYKHTPIMRPLHACWEHAHLQSLPAPELAPSQEQHEPPRKQLGAFLPCRGTT